MIKSIVNEDSVNEYTWPKLMICTTKEAEGLIVLITSDGMLKNRGRGFVMKTGVSKLHEIGYFSDMWVLENFKFYTGSVTLYNEK